LKALVVAAGAGDVVSECRAVDGDPPETIASIAARDRGALIVLTLRGRGGLTRTRAGSITYHVLTKGAAPVLALPPGTTIAPTPRRPRSGTSKPSAA
jgi:nucleotide-binding universal stress UspA family protein